MNYKTPSGQEYPEFTKFTRYKAPCGITWVCLETGDKQVLWYDLSQLHEVVSPFETGMVYTCAEPPRSLAIWRPTVEVPITQLGYYREGSKQKAIPGLNLTMCNVRIVLTLPEAKVA